MPCWSRPVSRPRERRHDRAVARTVPYRDMGMTNKIETPALRLSWVESSWDAAVFGAPVFTIDHIEVLGESALRDAKEFLDRLAAVGARLSSCRLPHDRLRESMLLEDMGFRFIEMIYQPVLDDLATVVWPHVRPLAVMPAAPADLPALLEIAGNAFSNERFHVDPRLPREAGDRRYQNWVRSAIDHPRQRLQTLRDGADVVGFFVTELMNDGTCYWHLNAIAPQAQGRGIGRRAWSTMLALARDAGAERVRTSVVARNVRVLNLYATLGFRLESPAMTFHWVRSS